MAFAPRSAKTIPARGNTAGSRNLKLNAPSSTRRSQEPSGSKAPVSKPFPLTTPKTSQSVPTTGKSVKPSVSSSTRKVPHAPAISGPKAAATVNLKPNAKPPVRSVSTATSSNDASVSDHPIRVIDPLQVAAQLYPWLYMTSTLETTMQAAESSSQNALDKHAHKLSEEEADIAEQRVRFDAERRVVFFEELAGNTLSREVPEIMQSFLRNGEICEKITADALRVSAQECNQIDYAAPVGIHNAILYKLDSAHTGATRLVSSIKCLLDAEDAIPTNSPLTSIFGACLPVLRARIANLVTAQSLVESAKANIGRNLQLESLRLTV